MSFLSVIFGTQFVTTVRGFQYHYWTSEVTVDPESPTTADKVNVTVSFSFTTMPPLVEEFGNLTQVGNVFSVNVSIYDQRLALPIVYEARYTYHLGRLPAGSYQFKVYVNYTFEDFLLHWYWLEKTISFTVTPSPRAEFTYSPPYPGINATMTFDASDSKPGWNGTHIMPIVSFAWDFGDGTNTTQIDPIVEHTYTTAGDYAITLNVTDGQGLWNITSQIITVNLAEFSLVTLYKVHLDLDYWFGTGANLTVAFYTYDGEYQGNTTVWTGITPKRVVFSTNITHSQGKPIEIVNLVLTDNFGNILQTIITFVVHRSDLFGRTAQIAMRWPFALLAERITLFKELTAICRQWPYAPT